MKRILTFFAVSFLAAAAFAADTARPNIILCMTDDQGRGDVSYNGLTKIKTPNIDAPWKQSVLQSFSGADYEGGKVIPPLNQTINSLK